MILSDVNQVLFRNMKDRAQGGDKSMYVLMATLSGLVVDVVCDQLGIPA